MQNMRQGAIFSALFHLAIVALVIIGLPSSSNPFEVGNPRAVPIVFENSPLAEVTQQVEGTAEPVAEAVEEPAAPPQKPEPEPLQQAALETPPEPEPTPPQPEPVVEAPPPPAVEPTPAPPEPVAELPTPPEPEPVAEPAPPEPTPPEPVAEPVVEPAPPQPTPEPVAQPEPAPAPEPTPVPEQVATAVPAPAPEIVPEPEPEPEPEPVVAPQPEPEPAPAAVASLPETAAPPLKPVRKVTVPEPVKQQEPVKQNDPLASILKDVTKREETQPQTKPQEQQQAAATTTDASSSRNLGSRVSRTLQDAIGQQVAKCWNVDVGTKGIEELSVDIRAFMRPDGTVERAEIVDAGRYAGDAFYKATADRALRAVLNSRCQPFPLPADAYDEWSVIIFAFDPKVMF